MGPVHRGEDQCQEGVPAAQGGKDTPVEMPEAIQKQQQKRKVEKDASPEDAGKKGKVDKSGFQQLVNEAQRAKREYYAATSASTSLQTSIEKCDENGVWGWAKNSKSASELSDALSTLDNAISDDLRQIFITEVGALKKNVGQVMLTKRLQEFVKLRPLIRQLRDVHKKLPRTHEQATKTSK